MPPWHIDRKIGEYHPDPSLSDGEIAVIVKWADSGAPQGRPEDAPPAAELTALDAWQFGEPDLVVTSPEVMVRADSPDMFTETEVETTLTSDRYIKWIQVIPESREALHHVVVYAVQDEASSGALFPDEADPRGSQRRFLLIEHFVGNDGDIFADDTAKLLKAGSKLRFSFHYYGAGKDVRDRTRIGFGFYPDGIVPKHRIVTTGILIQDLNIPPGADNVRHEADFTLDRPAKIVSFQPHMHYRGKRMTLGVIHPGGRRELLTDATRYTFNWQITYPYKNPPVLAKGTILRVTSYHDNSSRNRHNPDPSAWVGWGDRTIDEMAVGWTDLVYLTDEDYEQHLRAQKERQSAQPGGRER
jgi:hypothetical protein